MATIKAVVMKHQRRKDGKYPVSIRVYKDGTSVYIGTEFYIDSSQINRRTFEIRDGFVIERTNKTIREMERKMLVLSDDELGNMTCQELRNFLQTSVDGVDYMQEYLRIAATKPIGTKRCYMSTFKRLRRVVGSDRLPIIKFNSTLVRAFVADLDKCGCTNNHKNTEVCRLKCVFERIKRNYNTEFYQLITHDPFFSWEPLKANGVLRSRDISNSEFVDLLETIKRNEMLYAISLVSFYLCGANAIDICSLKKSDLCNGRISYKRQKTRSRRADEALISIKVEPELQWLLDRYKGSGDNLFCFADGKEPSMLASNIGHKYSRITKGRYMFYMVRHKWANIARMECDIHDDDIDFCLCHTGYNRMANRYTGRTWAIIDRVNRAVIDFFNGLYKIEKPTD